MKGVVVDTNVLLVANGQHQDVSDACVAACALRLQAIMKREKLVIDDLFMILGEYQNKTSPKTGNRPGDAFLKWALQNNRNQERVHTVSLEKHPVRGFESFPDDPDLTNFDPPDRKFIAIANSHVPKPPILQAADSKWIDSLCANDSCDNLGL